MSDHRIHWQPGVEEIVAREVAKAVEQARQEFHALHLGVLAQARREAWDEGYMAADLMAHQDRLPCAVVDTGNPYRAALADPKEKP